MGSLYSMWHSWLHLINLVLSSLDMVEIRSSGRAKTLLQMRDQRALPSWLCNRKDNFYMYSKRHEVQTNAIDSKSKVFMSHNLVSRTPLLLHF